MAKETSINALAGRIIESAVIRHGYSEDGPGLELRLVGGLVFEFQAGASITCTAQTVLYRDKNDKCDDAISRTFQSEPIIVTDNFDGV